MAELRHQSKAGLIGVIDFPGSTPPDVVEARRLELQAWLSGPGKLSAHFVKSVAVCSFVRFRVDGSIDPDRDERRNLDALGEVLTRELPGEAQVEMARLVSAKKVQLEISQHLVRSLTTVCAAIGLQPIPFADFPILTAIQFAMVSGIMHVSGRELGLKSAAEFFGAMGANIGVGMILREGARAGDQAAARMGECNLRRSGGGGNLRHWPIGDWLLCGRNFARRSTPAFPPPKLAEEALAGLQSEPSGSAKAIPGLLVNNL